MARRGRKRSIDAKRRATTIEGRVSRLEPTPELIAHRRREHGMDHVGTEHPLDALAAKGLLCDRRLGEAEAEWRGRNAAACDAGTELYALHRAVFGAGEPQALDITRPIGGALSTAAASPTETRGDIGRAARYRNLTAILRAAGTRVHHVTMNVVVYRRKLPDPATRPAAYRRTLDGLRLGLDLIAATRTRRYEDVPARAAE
jgi:hypothetical protein